MVRQVFMGGRRPNCNYPDGVRCAGPSDLKVLTGEKTCSPLELKEHRGRRGSSLSAYLQSCLLKRVGVLWSLVEVSERANRILFRRFNIRLVDHGEPLGTGCWSRLAFQ